MEEKKIEEKKKKNYRLDVARPCSCSSSGSKFFVPVDYEFDNDVKAFVPVVDESKKINRWLMIQSYKNSCDINVIIQRAKAGDFSALNARQGTFADVSTMPDNLNDLNQFSVEMVNQFNSLDPNLRAAFGNDITKFQQAVNDGSFVKIINQTILANNNNKANENKATEPVVEKKDGE